jgi:hypothetical protein
MTHEIDIGRRTPEDDVVVGQPTNTKHIVQAGNTNPAILEGLSGVLFEGTKNDGTLGDLTRNPLFDDTQSL